MVNLARRFLKIKKQDYRNPSLNFKLFMIQLRILINLIENGKLKVESEYKNWISNFKE